MVAVTPADQQVQSASQKKNGSGRPDDLVRVAHELRTIERDFVVLDESYGRNIDFEESLPCRVTQKACSYSSLADGRTQRCNGRGGGVPLVGGIAPSGGSHDMCARAASRHGPSRPLRAQPRTL
jgi:hypothetical protein